MNTASGTYYFRNMPTAKRKRGGPSVGSATASSSSAGTNDATAVRAATRGSAAVDAAKTASAKAAAAVDSNAASAGEDADVRRTRSSHPLPPEPPMKSAYKYRPPRVDSAMYQVRASRDSWRALKGRRD